jgi:hypothetical protein
MVDQPSKFSGQWGWGLYIALHSRITPPPIVPLDHSIVPPQYLTVTNLHFYFHDVFFYVGDRIKVCSKLLDTFFLISTNLDTLLNIYDRFMEHCIPKLFVHILLRLDCSACDSNDTPQEAHHASISSRQMVIQYTCYRIYVRGLRG